MTDKNKAFILWFNDLTIGDVGLVGGKNAALGEMVNNLVPLGVNVPNGFAITAHAYAYFLDKTGLKQRIKEILTDLNTHNINDLQKRGAQVRAAIIKEELPEELQVEIINAYRKLSANYHSQAVDVAVRSSATAEDLPGASFAGQQETYLNVASEKELMLSVRKCFASLFTNRAISYRVDKGFSMFDVLLSVGVQKMVRSDLAAAGVMFSVDTETGFDKVVVINGAYGLGEMVVLGKVTPDEFVVFKPSLERGYQAILSKTLGRKDVKLVYGAKGTKQVSVPAKEVNRFCLKDEEVSKLAAWGLTIEKYFSGKHNRYQPMDMEWAKDGKTGELFIVQARPETVHAEADKNVYEEHILKEKGKELVRGNAIGAKITAGKVRLIKSANQMNTFKPGEILVTEITDPDWEPIMKIAAAIITEKGGRTSHAAIVSRELGVPSIVGTGNATKVLKNGQLVTVDCSSGKEGVVYEGKLAFEKKEHRLTATAKTRTKVMVNIGSPDDAFRNFYLPVSGVGLGRLEFIINSYIKVHPNALLDYKELKASRDPRAKKAVKAIDELTVEYKNKTDYYVGELAEGVAKIAATFYPHDVIIRFSDFKTNEYRTLIGGDLYEPEEENPMIGWRGASRYYDPNFRRAFALECRALYQVRSEMGLSNVIPMIPFCRTAEEGRQVVEIMTEAGLDRQADPSLKIYVMCEIPSNVVEADAFLEVFDGMSIGSNDLTQLMLGLDRDSNLISHIANENHPAVKKMIEVAIKACRAKGKYIGICGQAPSDYPEFADFLVQNGIGSISLNPDSVIKTLPVIEAAEEKYPQR
ncbi:MAG: phosphoenolpyruvate synthase [Candidatus Vogelbacteria bacterium CG10_big_fil_rev_8_21_14_0_10_49_38]|uniref:Phosphoenolpyruvate synthase n=1 Tax=Candidatus Vogelbacteria bacterium CG10_big_fil_rev_8_21_14_0_10_49_38 TaxID=1975043 RepID=A0A2H0RIA3_9BACT|nr:MAG: phosphoenolpyruvate synthase [bacterium CG10_49_38]PIR46187.1 MAG: phosphoenolpyruvate synthase [Candidatus Vogelbacteria bacterium CG10_big_fil_rev_8_21_14_0_10_49_38]